jgi:HK97 family phage portal protein
MNRIQKAAAWMFEKATGFPVWRSLSLLDPSGWSDSSYNGTNVQGLAALQLSTIWGCCSVLNRAVAPLPIYIVEKNGASRKILDNHYLTDVLGFAPNPLMTSLELLEAMLLSFNLWGNAYVEKRLISGKVRALYPMDPSRMRVIVENGDVRYEYAQKTGQLQKFKKEEILHVKNFSLDGINGLSPIACLREAVGRGIDAQRFGANYLRNGGQPSRSASAPEDARR